MYVFPINCHYTSVHIPPYSPPVARYFSKGSHHGVCIYRRRPTTELGLRGFHLSSLGILLGKSARPRPWRHVSALKELSITLYSRFDAAGALGPMENEWEPAIAFFNERKVKRADLGGAGDWNGWSYEMDNVSLLPLATCPRITSFLDLRHLATRNRRT